jgi:uncharacterized protein (TIGR00297 family)
VFAVTWLATRWGYAVKQQRGTAEPCEGRNARQVLANLGVAAGCAAFYMWGTYRVWLVALVAALAEAAADTASSEVGQATSDTAVLITSWKRVPAGTDGGVSGAGTGAGIAAAAIIGIVSMLTGLVSRRGFCVVLVAGTAGMVMDSLLGAWLERRGVVSNDAVNWCGTASAAGLVLVLQKLLSY